MWVMWCLTANKIAHVCVCVLGENWWGIFPWIVKHIEKYLEVEVNVQYTCWKSYVHI